MAVRQLEAGRAEVENQYARTVARDGNRAARELDRRGLRGRRPQVARRRRRSRSRAIALRDEYRDHDAERHLRGRATSTTREPALCISGQVLRGIKKPSRLPGVRQGRARRTRRSARPWSPAEGACAAYFQYGRRRRMSEVDPRKSARERGHAARTSSRQTRRASTPAPRRWPTRFREGGRLFTHGQRRLRAATRSIVAVEFQHPIIEKRRALPAICLTSDAGAA